MTRAEMENLKEGDLVWCMDAKSLYDTKMPHVVIENTGKRVSCRATALRKSTKDPLNGDNLSNPDTNMHYGMNDHALLEFAGVQVATA